MMYKIIRLLVLFCMAITLFSPSLTWGCRLKAVHGPKNIVCPLDGSLFYDYEMGTGDDFNAPPPRCTSNGFVLYKAQYSAAELKKFREFVVTDDFKRYLISPVTVASELANPHNFFVAGKLMAFNGENPRAVAHMFLKAVPYAKSDEQLELYAQAAWDAFKQSLEKPYVAQDNWLENEHYDVRSVEKINYEHWLNDQLLTGELERRLEMFDEAEQRFLMLLSLNTEPKFKRRVNHQLGLARWGNTEFRCTPELWHEIEWTYARILPSACDTTPTPKCNSYGLIPFSFLASLLLVILAAFLHPNKQGVMSRNALICAVVALVLMAIFLLGRQLIVAPICMVLISACLYRTHLTKKHYAAAIVIALIVASFVIFLLRNMELGGLSRIVWWPFVVCASVLALISLFVLWRPYSVFGYKVVSATSTMAICFVLPMFLSIPESFDSATFILEISSHSVPDAMLSLMVAFSGYIALVISVLLKKVQTREHSYFADFSYWLNVVTPMLIVHPVMIFLGIFNGSHDGLSLLLLLVLYMLMALFYLLMNVRVFVLPGIIYLLYSLAMLYFSYYFINLAVFLVMLIIMLGLLSLYCRWSVVRTALLKYLPRES